MSRDLSLPVDRIRGWRAGVALVALGVIGGCSEASAPPPPLATAPCTVEVPVLLGDGSRDALTPSAPAACLVEGAVRIGDVRVPFDPARAGDALSLALADALPEGARVVDLWAAADCPAGDVVHLARALGRSDIAVRMVTRKGDDPRALARIDPPRPDLIAPPGTIPEDIEVWVDISPSGPVVAHSDGGLIEVELGPAGSSGRWDPLTDAMLTERQVAPDQDRIAFVVAPEVPHRDLAHAIEIATAVGFTRVELTPAGVLEAMAEEFGYEQLRREGGVHPLPERERPRAEMPETYAPFLTADTAAPATRSQVEVGAIDVGGYLDQAAVEQHVTARLDELAFCHERAPGAVAAGDACAIMALVVAPDGHIRSVGAASRVHPTGPRCVFDDAPMAVCLRARIAAWGFPPSRTGHVAGVRVPLTFSGPPSE